MGLTDGGGDVAIIVSGARAIKSVVAAVTGDGTYSWWHHHCLSGGGGTNVVVVVSSSSSNVRVIELVMAADTGDVVRDLRRMVVMNDVVMVAVLVMEVVHVVVVAPLAGVGMAVVVIVLLAA